MNFFSRMRGICLWRGLLGIIGGALIIAGLFGPWLWKPLPLRRARDIGVIYEISPLRARVIERGEAESMFWFFDFSLSLGISMSLMGLIAGAIQSIMSFGRWKLSLAGFLFYITSFFLFFYSFGRGMSIGIWTLIGWGLRVTLVGGVILFASAIINLIHEKVE